MSKELEEFLSCAEEYLKCAYDDGPEGAYDRDLLLWNLNENWPELMRLLAQHRPGTK